MFITMLFKMRETRSDINICQHRNDSINISFIYCAVNTCDVCVCVYVYNLKMLVVLLRKTI